MSNYSNTKATIAANVYTNHNHEVTAAMVKTGINAVVDTLIAGGFLYKGVATTSTNPGSPDANVFYIATAPGTYTNFGSLVVNDGEVAILKYNGSWSKEVTGAATSAEVSALGHYIDNNDWIRVIVDGENKILFGIKADGAIEWSIGVPTPVVNYITALLAGKVDVEEGKGLIDSEFASSQSVVDATEYLQVVTDEDGKIVEGLMNDGKKYINDFDARTAKRIRDISGRVEISIPVLDSNFTSPVPVTITGTKGDENAEYEFDLPLSEDAYNIRFKFKITENILNQSKNAVIAELGGASAAYATIQALSQLLSSRSYGGEIKVMNWPTLRGGIKLNGSSVSRTPDSGDKQNIGNFAFYVYYVGESNNVTIQNTGSALIIKVNGTATTLSYTTYPTVAELYEAVKALTDFEVSYNEIETRECSELAIFPECSLVNTYYSGINGGKNDEVVEYEDTAPFFIPYAVSEEWHQVEIVKTGGVVYASCDGTTITINPASNILVLGGGCGVIFKDLLIDTTSCGDAEIVDGVLISSVNPHIIIHEGHDIIQTPTSEIADPSGNLGTTVDRLQLVYSKMIGKGYVPVSLDEIADYYAGNRLLPKRCFTSIFDDYRWVNCLDLSNRAVFTRLGIMPGLAIITSNIPSTILHDGNEITIQQAAVICRDYRFGLFSHTRNHRDCNNVKPSAHFGEITADVYDGDIKGIDNSILVYPYGHAPVYMTDVLKWLGFRLGINIMRSGFNIKNRSKYDLTRVEIGVTENISELLDTII